MSGLGANAESSRIRLLREGVVAANISNRKKPTEIICTVPEIIPERTTMNQHTYILQKAILCPIVYSQATTLCGSQPVYTPQIPYLPTATEGPQGPGVPVVERQFDRISGIDVICKPIPNRSSSSRTAQIRVGLETAASTTRYGQTVLPIIPYPEYIPTPSGPQAGVPEARAPNCLRPL